MCNIWRFMGCNVVHFVVKGHTISQPQIDTMHTSFCKWIYIMHPWSNLWDGERVLVRTFDVMYDHTFLNLQITRSDIRPHIKWAVSLVIAYGHFNLKHILFHHTLKMDWTRQNATTLFPTHNTHSMLLRGLCGMYGLTSYFLISEGEMGKRRHTNVTITYAGEGCDSIFALPNPFSCEMK